MLPVWLSYAPIALAAAYATGGPAAFAAGAVTRYLFECGLAERLGCLGLRLCGGSDGHADVFLLDEFVLPKPILGKCRRLGTRMARGGRPPPLCARSYSCFAAAAARPKPR